MSYTPDKWTDKELEALEKRIAKVYKEAENDLNKEVNEYFAKFKVRDKEMKDLVDAGEMTNAEYMKWRSTQMGRGQRFEALRDKVAERYTKANEVATAYVNDATPSIYSLNRNFEAYTIEKAVGSCDFTMWDESTVRRLLVEEPDLMPYYPPQKALDRGIDLAYGKDQITKRVTSGIIRGLPPGKIANELMQGITTMNRESAVRAARTGVTAAENAGRLDSYIAAEKMGIQIKRRWVCTKDARTRFGHAMADGQTVVGTKEPFIVDGEKMMFPGDKSLGAHGWNIYNCRCTTRTVEKDGIEAEPRQMRVRDPQTGEWKVVNEMTYQDWAEWKKTGVQPTTSVQPAPKKKEYLTKKKLEEKIAEIEKQLSTIQDATQLEALEKQKAEYQEKLDKKVAAAEIKKLKKEEILLQDQLDGYDIKTYSNIWKDDVTTADWGAKQGSVQAKKQYFENKLKNATDQAEIDKWKGLLDDLDDFDKKGSEYYSIQSKLAKTKSDLTKLQNSGKISQGNADAYTQERKDAAHWFTNKNGGTKGADGVLRDTCGEVWRNATSAEKDAIYGYTRSYSKINEPLRGIEYGTNKYLGVGNVDLDMIGVNGYGNFKRGEVRKQIDAMTSIIEKSSYTDDIWVQRGCNYGGMDKFFGIDSNDFNLSESELAAKLLGTTPTEYAFMSTGVSKGKGFSHCPIIMNIYAPSGTKMMYAEPFSAFGNGAGRSWDGISKQSTFGSEAEMILQRNTTFRVTKVEKSGGKIYIDMDVISQGEGN